MAGLRPIVGRIFISYRRSESAVAAGRVYKSVLDWVSANGGSSKQVFIDLASMYPANDYREVLKYHIATSEVFLAVIGKDWLTVQDDNGRQRIAQPNDPVRLEVESALGSQRTHLIPILVNDARPVRASELPASIAGLAYAQTYVSPAEGVALPSDLLGHFRTFLTEWSGHLNGKKKGSCALRADLTYGSHMISYSDKVYLPGRGESDIPSYVAVDGNIAVERKYSLGPSWEFTIKDGPLTLPAELVIGHESYGLFGLSSRIGSISLTVNGYKLYAD
jgi:hypothetical protein